MVLKTSINITLLFLLLMAGNIQAQNQVLWGMCNAGGNGNGTIFHINDDGSGFIIVHYFQDTIGSQPYGDLLKASNNKLYGTCPYGPYSPDSGLIFMFDPSTNLYNSIH